MVIPPDALLSTYAGHLPLDREYQDVFGLLCCRFLISGFARYYIWQGIARQGVIWLKGENTANKGLVGHTAVLNALVSAGKEVLMEKHQLAKELRQLQYDKGIVEKRMIDACSDNEIIDGYITCSRCGEKKVNEQDLETAINIAQNANQFFQLC